MGKAIHIAILLAALVWFAVGPLGWMLDEPPMPMPQSTDGATAGPGPVGRTTPVTTNDDPVARYVRGLDEEIARLTAAGADDATIAQLRVLRHALAPPDPDADADAGDPVRPAVPLDVPDRGAVDRLLESLAWHLPPVLASQRTDDIERTFAAATSSSPEAPDAAVRLRELLEQSAADARAAARITDGAGALSSQVLLTVQREANALSVARLHAMRQSHPRLPGHIVDRLREALAELQRLIEAELRTDDRAGLLRQLERAQRDGDWDRVQELAARLKEYDLRLSLNRSDCLEVTMGSASYRVFIEGDGSVIVIETPSSGESVQRQFADWNEFRQALGPVARRLEFEGDAVETRTREARDRALIRDRRLLRLAHALADVTDARVAVESAPGPDGRPVTAGPRSFPPQLMERLADAAMQLAEAAQRYREWVEVNADGTDNGDNGDNGDGTGEEDDRR